MKWAETSKIEKNPSISGHAKKHVLTALQKVHLLRCASSLGIPTVL
jgi:hypothetical protein